MGEELSPAGAVRFRRPRTLPRDVGVNSPELVRRVVAANNYRIAGLRPEDQRVPSELSRRSALLESAFGSIRAEWDTFESGGGVLPPTSEVFGGSQGSVGDWRSGLLLLRGRSVGPLADEFPATVSVLRQVPGLLSAMWSLFEPGAELPEHCGDNAGGLRLLFGVRCPAGSGHSMEGVETHIGEGEARMFDDTRPHAAWNRSDAPRVLILADVLRPLPFPANVQNICTQWLRHYGSAPYRRSAKVAGGLHRQLNVDSA